MENIEILKVVAGSLERSKQMIVAQIGFQFNDMSQSLFALSLVSRKCQVVF